MMNKELFIKICGITNEDDALLAADLGATALGFIFASSKRQVTPARAKNIIATLPQHIEKVGVFVDEQQDKIWQIAEMVGLTIIQLHGNESPAMCDKLGQYFKIIKTVKIDPRGRVVANNDCSCWKILLDTYVPQTEGGSGISFNWDILSQFNPDEIIVAGGLSPDNVQGLLSRFQPFGIDVCSGVEAYPGKKEVKKLNRFFKKIGDFNWW